MTTATATPATITISTTPMAAARLSQSSRSLARRSTGLNPLVGLVARVVAGITGVLLGLAIGLVSAGFDTTRLLLALGAVALGIGWAIALFTARTDTSRNRR